MAYKPRHHITPVESGNRTPPAPIDSSTDVPRARTMPPRLAHMLTGEIAEPRRYDPRERQRLISRRAYPPYAPLYALLAGRSMAAVARQAGLGLTMLAAILRGRREPYFYAGLKLARALGVSPDELDRYLDRVQRHPLE